MKFEQSHVEGGELLEQFDFLPDYKIGYCTGIVDCGDSTYLMDIAETFEVDFYAYRDTLRANDFRMVAQNHIHGNHFFTMQNDTHNITMIYIPCKANARLIVEPIGNLPAQNEEPYTRICEPLFVVVGAHGSGMSFILRLADGRFVLVDGGGGDATAETFLSVLRQLAPNPKQITVAAWIVTHSHGDHVGAFIGMARNHVGELNIEKILYNFPSNEQASVYTQKLDFIADIIRDLVPKAYPDIPLYKPHPGQVFHFANLKVEILSTHELHYPPFPNLWNDCCIVMRWTIDGQVIMLPADSDKISFHTLAQMYGTYLRCDILQADHHGSFGGTCETNTLFAPHTIIYLCPDDAFNNRFQYSDYNICLLNNPNFKEKILMGDRITVLPLPYQPGSSYLINE